MHVLSASNMIFHFSGVCIVIITKSLLSFLQIVNDGRLLNQMGLI